MLGKPAAVVALLVILSPVAFAAAVAQESPPQETPPGVIGGPLVVESGDHQIDPDRAAEMQARLEEAAARLALSDAQRESVRPILLTSFEQAAAAVQTARAGGRPGFAELRRLRSDLQAIDEQAKTQLSGILSAEQRAELEAIQKERRDELRERLREQRDSGSAPQ